MPTPVTVTRLRFVNAHLVAEDDGLTVIDTGIPGTAKAILAVAERTGLPVVRIALTHAHGDHVGSLDALATARPDAEVSISARDARLLDKDKSLDPRRAGRQGARRLPGDQGTARRRWPVRRRCVRSSRDASPPGTARRSTTRCRDGRSDRARRGVRRG